MIFNRRSFIGCASLAAAGHLAGLRPFGAMNALAAETTPDYKALVCIFLYGGNDANNTVVPFDTAGYANYQRLRGPLALSRSSLLQLSTTPTFALHPNMPEIQALYDKRAATIVANVGTLVQPLSRSQYQAGQLETPSNLFSHPDQQLEWQNASQSGAVTTGWAGRIADQWGTTYGSNPRIPLITSVDGDTLFCNGAASSPVALSPGEVAGGGHCSEGSSCPGRIATEQAIVRVASGISMVQADKGITANAYKYMTNVADALQSVTPVSVPFPNTALGLQLRQIAQIIQVRQALGVNRQIFFAGLGNFDTHAAQLGTQATLLTQLSQAMGAFDNAIIELGVGAQVTTFTMSDFSRAFQPNSNYGSDHAWGGHHIVMGGAVQGGKIYGTFPTLALNGPDDSGVNGRWVPSTASVQYASTLASWFGVSAGDLPAIFPTIGNFSRANLGFLG
jgi:uncharacterized protein (DUF1501 family)